MAFSKITLNGTTLVDMTDATAGEEQILSPYTAYGADGQKKTGTASGGDPAEDIKKYANGTLTEIDLTGVNSIGAAYTEAYDPEEFGRVYEEGEIIESEATDEDYAEAGKILMGEEE